MNVPSCSSLVPILLSVTEENQLKEGNSLCTHQQRPILLLPHAKFRSQMRRSTSCSATRGHIRHGSPSPCPSNSCARHTNWRASDQPAPMVRLRDSCF